MLDNFVFKCHAQRTFARSLCLKRHSSSSILHEIFTVNGTNAVSNTAQHVWMYAWSLSYWQSEQRPKCFWNGSKKFCKQEFTSSHELKLHRAGCFWACDVSGCEIKGATRKKDIDRHARKHAAEKEKHNRFSQLCDREATRGGKPDFWKSISKAAAQDAFSRLYPPFS